MTSDLDPDSPNPVATSATRADTRASWDDPRAGDARDRERARARLRARLLDGSAQPPTIGRFHILERVGQGGMGTVYAAHDDLLDRKVALKVIRGEPSPDRRARMLREAQAMAKLSHPNVVAVYEIGVHEDEVHIAMEFIRGQSLPRWVEGRTWREVLDVYLQAGRAMAAAHAAGLVHRDFKPENVMVDEDGRARVLDFGLAQRDSNHESDPGEASPASVESAFETPLTVTGARIGTPAYMAPEQMRGERADPFSDQFSFCVSLYEALYGHRPFRADTLASLVASIAAGEIDKPPKNTTVPGWAWPIVARGLSSHRDERWPSMKALCDALSRGAKRRRRRLVAILSAVMLVFAVTGWLAWTLDRDRRRAMCVSEGEAIADVWNDDIRARLHDALLASGASHAPDTAEKLMPWLDAHADAWQRMRTESCSNTAVHGIWDADARDRSQWCLDERRMELAALVDELSAGRVRALDEAVHGASRLTPVESCRDMDVLSRLPAPPSLRRDDVRAVRAELARAGALETVGSFPEALAVAQHASIRADELSWPPLVAAARYRVGRLLERNGDHAGAEQELEASFFAAMRAGTLDVGVDAAIRLVHTVGYRLARPAEGVRWFHHAELVLESLSDPGGLRRAALLNSLATLRQASGDHGEAKALHERVLETSQEALGPAHPDVASTLTNLGNVHAATGAHAEAKALHERALAIVESALGHAHPAVAASLNNLAIAHQSMGALHEASVLHERALTIREQSLGVEHLDVAQSLNNLAAVYQAGGAHERARPLFERALSIRERALGPGHPQVAASLHNLADLDQIVGAFGSAKGLHERALAIWETALGPEHPVLSHSLLGLAEVALAEQRFVEAVALAERAVLLRETSKLPETELAEARFVLARARWETGASPRAVELAEQALEGYRRAAATKSEELSKVEHWLETHASP